MKNLIFMCFFSFSSVAFFSNEIAPVKETLLDNAIEKNQFNEFKRLLGNSSSSKQKGKLSEGFGHHLLAIATSSDNWHHTTDKDEFLCRPKFVEYLLSKGSVPKTIHFQNAVNSICPKSISILLKTIPKQSLAIVSNQVLLNNFSNIKNNPKLAPRLVETITILGKKNKSLCTQRNSNCKALKHLRSEISKLEDLEKNENKKQAFYKTKQGQVQLIWEKICFFHQQYLRYQKKIDEEKQKAKISGYVNASLLKEWGDQAYAEKRKRDLLLSKRNLKFNTKKCKLY